MQSLLTIVGVQTAILIAHLILNFIILKDIPEIIRNLISFNGSIIIFVLLVLSIIISKLIDIQRLKYKKDLDTIYKLLDKLYIENYEGLGGEISNENEDE